MRFRELRHGCPIAAASMVEFRFPTECVRVELAFVKYFASHHPGADGPTGEFDTVPRAPTRFRNLILIANCLPAIQINEREISIIARRNSTFIEDVPYTCRSIAHPIYDLLKRTTPTVYLIEHQRERIFDGWNPRGRS